MKIQKRKKQKPATSKPTGGYTVLNRSAHNLAYFTGSPVSTSKATGKQTRTSSRGKLQSRASSVRRIKQTSLLLILFDYLQVASVRSSSRASPLQAALEEVISTSQGTSFYVLTQSSGVSEGPVGPGVFLTQDEGLIIQHYILY